MRENQTQRDSLEGISNSLDGENTQMNLQKQGQSTYSFQTDDEAFEEMIARDKQNIGK